MASRSSLYSSICSVLFGPFLDFDALLISTTACFCTSRFNSFYSSDRNNFVSLADLMSSWMKRLVRSVPVYIFKEIVAALKSACVPRVIVIEKGNYNDSPTSGTNPTALANTLGM